MSVRGLTSTVSSLHDSGQVADFLRLNWIRHCWRQLQKYNP